MRTVGAITAIFLWMLRPAEATKSSFVSCGAGYPNSVPIPGHVAQDVLVEYLNHKLHDHVEVFNNSTIQKVRIALGPGGIFGGLKEWRLHARYSPEDYRPFGWLNIATTSSNASTENNSSSVDAVFTKKPRLGFPQGHILDIVQQCGGREAEDVSGHIDTPDGLRHELYGQPWLPSDNKTYPPLMPTPELSLVGPAREVLDEKPARLACFHSGISAKWDYLNATAEYFCTEVHRKLLLPGGELKLQTLQMDNTLRFVKASIQVHRGGPEWRVDEGTCKRAFHHIALKCHEFALPWRQGGTFQQSNVLFTLDVNRNEDMSCPLIFVPEYSKLTHPGRDKNKKGQGRG